MINITYDLKILSIKESRKAKPYDIRNLFISIIINIYFGGTEG